MVSGEGGTLAVEVGGAGRRGCWLMEGPGRRPLQREQRQVCGKQPRQGGHKGKSDCF